MVISFDLIQREDSKTWRSLHIPEIIVWRNEERSSTTKSVILGIKEFASVYAEKKKGCNKKSDVVKTVVFETVFIINSWEG